MRKCKHAYDHVKAVAEKDDHIEIEMPEEVKNEYPEIDTAVSKEEVEQN